MVKIAARRVGQRRFRRSACLAAIGLTVSLGVAGAVAAAAMMSKPPRDLAGGSLSLRVAPSTRTVAPGASTTYALRVEVGQGGGRGLSGRTRLGVAGLPTGATASFSPGSTVVPRGKSHLPSKLTIQTSPESTAGTYRIQIRARRPHLQGRSTVTLIVAGPDTRPSPTAPADPAPAPAPDPAQPVITAPDAFTISGALSGLLIPGSEARLDLSLANLEDADLAIASLTVNVTGVIAPRSDALHPCGPEDFSVAQFSGRPGFTLPASSTATLGELGFSPAAWPRVSMLDSAANQNGCKSASLQLGFAGTATEVSP